MNEYIIKFFLKIFLNIFSIVFSFLFIKCPELYGCRPALSSSPKLYSVPLFPFAFVAFGFLCLFVYFLGCFGSCPSHSIPPPAGRVQRVSELLAVLDGGQALSGGKRYGPALNRAPWASRAAVSLGSRHLRPWDSLSALD